jgi:PPOX class probable F420-dependent enzyme
MALDPTQLSPDVMNFLAEYHLATLTTLRADGSPHSVPVGFSYDPENQLVRIIAADGSQKVVNADRGCRATVSQVDGGRWLTFEGVARVRREPDAVAAAVAGYTARYRPPRDNPERVAIEIVVDRILGRG